MCTGCQQCVNACSLALSGKCGQSESMIRVPIHPEFGTSEPVILAGCLETDCNGECVDFCPLNILKLAGYNENSALLMNEKWSPVPVLSHGDV